MKRVKKKEIYQAEQWFKGKNVKGVIDAGPFKETGHWSDRFTVHPDVYLEKTQTEVREGDWILTSENGELSVCSDINFKRLYEEV